MRNRAQPACLRPKQDWSFSKRGRPAVFRLTAEFLTVRTPSHDPFFLSVPHTRKALAVADCPALTVYGGGPATDFHRLPSRGNDAPGLAAHGLGIPKSDAGQAARRLDIVPITDRIVNGLARRAAQPSSSGDFAGFAEKPAAAI